MKIVSSDFDGQYKAAMQEISRLKDELKNIDITEFEQTMPFEYINKLDTKIIEATQEMAQYIKLILRPYEKKSVKKRGTVVK